MDNLVEIFGFLIVLMFSVSYFNEPKYSFLDEDEGDQNDEDRILEPALPRQMTNRYQYNLYLFIFILFAELLFIIMAKLLPQFLDEGDKKSGEYYTLVSALIIIGCLPYLPFVKDLLSKAKDFLHERAKIPNEGRSVYHLIKSRPISYNKVEINNILHEKEYEETEDVNGKKIRKDLNKTDFEAVSTTIEAKWAKLSWLINHLNGWEKNKIFSGFMLHHSLHWSSIKKSYSSRIKNIKEYKDNALSEAERAKLHMSLDTLLLRTYRMISCLVFLADKSSCDRNDYIKRLGYDIDVQSVFAIRFRQVALFALSCFLGILAGSFFALCLSLLAKNHFPALEGIDVGTDMIIKCCGYGVPFLTVPVIVVLLLKRHYSFGGERWPMVDPKHPFERISDRPFDIYLFVTLIAYFIASVTLLTMMVVFMKEVTIGNVLIHERTTSILIWSLVSAVTAFFIAYRLDSLDKHQSDKVKMWSLTILGAGFQGIVTVVVILFVFAHKYNDGSFDFSNLGPDLFGRLVVFSLIGFSVGFLLFISGHFNDMIRERRKHERFSINKKVTFTIGEDTAGYGELVNISRGGALLETTDVKKPIKRDICLQIKEGISVLARIVNLKNNLINLQFKKEYQWEEITKTFQLEPLPV